jgi:5-methyltetrahydropteroyltriglutamate--homocysteine methyltransferase
MVIATNLGYPRFGPRRELKRALERYWHGAGSAADLAASARTIRLDNWRAQQQAGITHIPSNDFSLYDGVLDTIAMVGAVPPRYGWSGRTVDLDPYFAMARGNGTVPAMEMTKWFDTNYHYIVPEFHEGQTFRLASTQAVDQFLEAQAAGIHTRPVLLGPVSFLLLGKAVTPGLEPLSLLPQLLPVYVEMLKRLRLAGVDWVQMDEPCLMLDLDEAARAAYAACYAELAAGATVKILLATYFGALGDNLPTALALPVDGLHLDLVRGSGQLDDVLCALPPRMALSLGLVDGRNVWCTDLAAALGLAERAVGALGSDRVLVGPSCSLLYCPHDLDLETELDPEVRPWLAFARQKLDEIAALASGAARGREAIHEALEAASAARHARDCSSRTHSTQVRARLAALTPDMAQRSTPAAIRRQQQQARLNLPVLPTTTIGSFPQTTTIRQARASYVRGTMSEDLYNAFLATEIETVIRAQEEIGLDVLVHGEAERTDMVEYFAAQLSGVLLTQHGWVQSYGSRGVRPPIIYGDVERPAPMTVRWASLAQSLTTRPMKGMLTGPVTMLQWSFVRDDQPRADTCRQLALAVRDEVHDLETAGIEIIQIDEPALREGLPLRHAPRADYLAWAVACFRLAASGVRDETQIHTHMCYAEFSDVIDAIAAMDADVISIEAARSRMEPLAAFSGYGYPRDIGPGVYDIHSPRVPEAGEIEALLERALEVIPLERLWVNPDCGLKTRTWEQAAPALKHMVAAARTLRGRLCRLDAPDA